MSGGSLKVPYAIFDSVGVATLAHLTKTSVHECRGRLLWWWYQCDLRRTKVFPRLHIDVDWTAGASDAMIATGLAKAVGADQIEFIGHKLRRKSRVPLRADQLQWTDHMGVTRTTPSSKKPLSFGRNSDHAALRVFVFFRDGFACKRCGASAAEVPDDYDGRRALATPGDFLTIDHVLAQINGGSHHPDNLQTLCGACNGAKGRTTDRSENRRDHAADPDLFV